MKPTTPTYFLLIVFLTSYSLIPYNIRFNQSIRTASQAFPFFFSHMRHALFKCWFALCLYLLLWLWLWLKCKQRCVCMRSCKNVSIWVSECVCLYVYIVCATQPQANQSTILFIYRDRIHRSFTQFAILLIGDTWRLGLFAPISGREFNGHLQRFAKFVDFLHTLNVTLHSSRQTTARRQIDWSQISTIGQNLFNRFLRYGWSTQIQIAA